MTGKVEAGSGWYQMTYGPGLKAENVPVEGEVEVKWNGESTHFFTPEKPTKIVTVSSHEFNTGVHLNSAIEQEDQLPISLSGNVLTDYKHKGDYQLVGPGASLEMGNPSEPTYFKVEHIMKKEIPLTLGTINAGANWGVYDYIKGTSEESANGQPITEKKHLKLKNGAKKLGVEVSGESGKKIQVSVLDGVSLSNEDVHSEENVNWFMMRFEEGIEPSREAANIPNEGWIVLFKDDPENYLLIKHTGSK